MKAIGGKIRRNNLKTKESAISSANTNNKPSMKVLIKERQVNMNKILFILLSLISYNLSLPLSCKYSKTSNLSMKNFSISLFRQLSEDLL